MGDTVQFERQQQILFSLGPSHIWSLLGGITGRHNAIKSGSARSKSEMGFAADHGTGRFVD